MNAADALRSFIAASLPGFRVQFGAWMDGTRTDRYAVIKPVGGLPASLVREPLFTLSLIGAENESAETIGGYADVLIEAMRLNSGTIVFMQPAEPVFMPSDDGRAIFELAISAITN